MISVKAISAILVDPTLTRGMGQTKLTTAGGSESREPRIPPRRSRGLSGRYYPRRYSQPDNEPHLFEPPDPPSVYPLSTTSSSSSDTRQHWAQNVFDGLYPVTPFSTHGSTLDSLSLYGIFTNWWQFKMLW